jgi:hypothetical protein
MRILVRPQLADIVSSGSILLINPPAVDTRIPWASMQQPLGLLQIGSSLISQGCSVRLIDCLQTNNNRLARTKVGDIKIDEYKIDIWQFGLAPKKVAQILRSWQKDGWTPEAILISSGLSCWWQGIKTTIDEIKSITSVPVILGGQYPTAYPEHAQDNIQADTLVVGQLQNLSYLPTDLNIYTPFPLPKTAAIHFFSMGGDGNISARPPDVVSDEIIQKCKLGISSFIWYDEWLLPEHKDGIAQILEAIISVNPKVNGGRITPSMIAPGNFSPRLIDKDIASLLKKANFRFISLHDDVIHKPFHRDYLSSLDDYRKCMSALKSAGFAERTGEIDAGMLIGIPGENIEEITRRMIQLSSLIGTIHLIPYQYSPNSSEGSEYTNWIASHNGHLDLAGLNGKLFPLVRIAGAKLESYWELTRLMALLNSKFRNQTHDFLGEGLISQMVKQSLKSELWNPFSVSPVETNEVNK